MGSKNPPPWTLLPGTAKAMPASHTRWCIGSDFFLPVMCQLSFYKPRQDRTEEVLFWTRSGWPRRRLFCILGGLYLIVCVHFFNRFRRPHDLHSVLDQKSLADGSQILLVSVDLYACRGVMAIWLPIGT